MGFILALPFKNSMTFEWWGIIFAPPLKNSTLFMRSPSMNLFQKSIEIVLDNQKKNGSYVASPNYPTYNYCWFRDGSFIAYSMDRTKNHSSSRNFHLWCAEVIERQSGKITSLIERNNSGEVIPSNDFLPARYSLNGFPTNDDWTDFQLDGYGTWLWAVKEHIEISGDDSILTKVTPAIEIILQYLTTFWDLPCYDFWEEHLEAIHPATLGAIYAGISAAHQLKIDDLSFKLTDTQEKIKIFFNERTIHPDGYYRKMVMPNGDKDQNGLTDLVDASLIGLAVPFNIEQINNENIQKTLKKIEKDIYYPNGGVYRYLEDTFYGGGEWILLSAWLGWYWCRTNQFDKAKQVKKFIQLHASESGELPEQISIHLKAPNYYSGWVNRWGEVAKPLLWSHAMYIILCEELKPYE